MTILDISLCLGVLVFAIEMSVSQSAVSCPPRKFHCDVDRCIPTRWRCDGASDCRDQSDEDNCEQTTCGAKYSRCDDGYCVPETWWCDGQSDCLDSSDEIGCGPSTIPTPTSPTPASTQASGSGDKVVLLVAGKDIWYRIPVGSGMNSSDVRKIRAAGGIIGEMTDFDVDISRQIMCWADKRWYTVMCGNLTNDMELTTYRVLDSRNTAAIQPYGVAIDWIHGNVYWTDKIKGVVSVGNAVSKGRGKKTLVNGLEYPAAIAVDPRNGWLFVGESRIRVVRYKLDGSDRTVVAEGDIGYIRGMSIDFNLDRLFWLDSRNYSFSSCDLEGRYRRTHVELNRRYHRQYAGIAVSTDVTSNRTSVYIGKYSGLVMIYSLDTGHNTILYDPQGYCIGIRLAQEKAQPSSTNPCEDNPCSHLCLPLSSIDYQCVCPDGFLLDANAQTCKYQSESKQPASCGYLKYQCKTGRKKCVWTKSVCNGGSDCPDFSDEGPVCTASTPFLLTIESGLIKKTSLADQKYDVSTLPGQAGRTGNARVLDVDVRKRQIYFATKNSILRADVSDSLAVQGNINTVIKQDSADIVDISVDWVHGLIYWVDGLHKSVSVSTQDGSFTKLLFTEGGPGAIAVDPLRGQLYVGDKPPRGRARLLKAGMDGSSRSVFMKDLGLIGGVAIDFQTETVYWTDHIIKAVMSLPLSGRGGLNVKSDTQKGAMSGLSVYQGWVFVSDDGKNTVRKTNQQTWEDVRQDAYSVRDTAVFDISSQPMAGTACTRINGGCSHVCIPTPTGQICACPPPMILYYHTECRYQDMLLVNDLKSLTRADLSEHTLNDDDVLTSKEMSIPVEGVNLNKMVVSVDFDVKNNAIFWADSSSGAIYMSHWKPAFDLGQCVKLFADGVDKPEGMAVDWVNQNMYWSDSGHHTISVGSLLTRSHRTLINTNIGVVKGMAVEPKTRWLYWTNWGRHMYSKVERCGLDGSNRQDVISSGLYTPNGLAIDYQSVRVFVGDAGRDVIISCTMTGTDCYTLHTSFKEEELSSITIHREFVYWADLKMKNVYRMLKNEEKDKKTVLEYVMSKPHDIVVFHPDRQPEVSPECGTNNGGCLLCLPTSETFRCACPDGLTLMPNGKSCDVQKLAVTVKCREGYTPGHDNTCVDVDECEERDVCSQTCENRPGSFTCSCLPGYSRVNKTECRLQGDPPKLLLVDGRRMWLLDRLHLPNPRRMKMSIPRSVGMRRPVGVDIDMDGKRIFWADMKVKAIKMARLRGRKIRSSSVLVGSGVKSPEGLAYDWLHDVVYWVDSGHGTIRVVAVSSKYTRTIHKGLDRPRAIALDPYHAYMYWTSWGTSPSIERSGFDGSGREIIIGTNIVWPNGLTIDYSEHRVYWTDGHMGVVSSCNMDGSFRKVVIFRHGEQPQQMFSVAVIENYVYWTDWKDRYVTRVTTRGEEMRKFTSVALRKPTDAKFIHPSRQMTGMRRCGKDNGGCSHICSPGTAASGRIFVCQCPDNMKLDGATCVSVSDNTQ